MPSSLMAADTISVRPAGCIDSQSTPLSKAKTLAWASALRCPSSLMVADTISVYYARSNDSKSTAPWLFNAKTLAWASEPICPLTMRAADMNSCCWAQYTVMANKLLLTNCVQAHDNMLEVLRHINLYLWTRRPQNVGIPGHMVEVGARPAGAVPGVVGCRAIAGGHTMTISPDLVCMRLGNTERHHGTACTCVPSRPLERGLCTGKEVSGGSYLACCSHCMQKHGASHSVRALSSLSSVSVLSSSVRCLRHSGGACNACLDAGNARPGAAASVGAFSWLRESEFTETAHVSLACLCMRADVARPANRVIEHQTLCVCVLGPCFLCALDCFCSRGDMSVGTNKRHHVSSRPRRGFLHARTRTHWVTSACDLFPW